MENFVIKRVHEPAVAGDGFRVLVDRLWPRGVSRIRAQLDDWQKDLAPSVSLRQWFDHDPERFVLFSAHYLDELRENPLVDAFVAMHRKQRTTLLYAAKSPTVNHAVILARCLNRRD